MIGPRIVIAALLSALVLSPSGAQFASHVVNSVAVGNVTGLGTNVATALGIAVGSAGGPVTNGGALGTPSSGVGTNLTGTASGFTAGNVTTNANLTGDVTSVGNAATLASTARLKSALVSPTRDLTTATGTQAVTGVGFQPTSCIAVGNITGSLTQYTAWGFSASNLGSSGLFLGTSVFQGNGGNFLIFQDVTGSNQQAATISSYDADGLTLSWTKTGSPTGTVQMRILCYR